MANYTDNTPDKVYDIPSGMSASDWQSILDANPYTNSKFREAYGDKMTWLEALGSAFGIRSNYEKTFGEYNRLSDEYIANAISAWRAEQYNSETETIEREKAAGINRDISGTPTDSAAVQNQAAAADIGSMNDTPNYVQLFDGIAQSIRVAVSVASGVGELNALDIGNTANLTDFITSHSSEFASIESIASLFSPSRLNEIADGSSLTSQELDAAVKISNDDAFSNYFSSRSARKRVRGLASRYLRSADYKNKISSQLSDYANNLPQSIGNAKFVQDNDFGDLISEPLKVVSTFYSELPILRGQIDSTSASIEQLEGQISQDVLVNSSNDIVSSRTAEHKIRAARNKGFKTLADWLDKIIDDPKVQGWKKLSALGIYSTMCNTIEQASLQGLADRVSNFLPSKSVTSTIDGSTGEILKEITKIQH